MGLWFPQGAATVARPPLWPTPQNIEAQGPDEPNLVVLALVAAWESPWQPYTQMKALVEENILKLWRCGHLLWFDGAFGECGCAHALGCVYTSMFLKNAAKP